MLKKVIPIILLLTFAGFISVFGQVPQEMTYQGVLTDAAGVPLTGNYQLTFRIYDVASGGSALWTEIHPSVDVSNGLFRVHLGTVNLLDLPFDIQYFVSVQVENETELSTRMRLTSVGYSFKSIKADSAENFVGQAGGDLSGNYPNPTINQKGAGNGQVLKWNGSAWVPDTDISGGTPSGTAGGDLDGTYPNPTVDGLRGRTVSTTAPGIGQVLEWSGTEWIPGTDDSGGTPSGTAGGDLDGTYPNPTVDGLRGRAVSTTAPGTGQVLEWSGTQWIPGTDDSGGTPSGTAGGDLTGTYPNPDVAGLRGRTVAAIAPSTGQVLEWSGTQWIPGTDDSGGTPSGTAGGDLTGTYPNPDVAALRGRTVATTTPTTGQVLEWSGTQWIPGTDDSGGTPSGTAGGDLTGTYPNPDVAALRGRTVATTTPTTGQVLEWSGTQWIPGTDDSGGTPSGTADGDLAGTYPNPTVDGLRGRLVATTAPSTGQVLEWSGSAWAPGTDNTGGIPSGTAGGDLAGTYPNPIVDGLRGRLVATTAPSTGQVLEWNGSSWAPGTDDEGGNTLDQAYDQGGAGAGRTITADAGAVNIAGIGGLETSGPIDHNYGAGGNGLNATGSTSAALYYISNGYAGSGWGLSAGMSSTSAGSSSYGVMGWNYGTGYGVYGRSLNASGTAVYGINSSTGNYGYLGGPITGIYGYHNSGNFGYAGSGSYGVYGYHADGNYGYIGGSSYGAYAISSETTTGTVGNYAIHTTSSNGTSYYFTSTMVGALGRALYGSNYHSGVQGTTYANDTGNRTSGVHGIFTDNDLYWGALAYQNSANTNYGVYATGGYGSPLVKGQASVGIGLGSWGDLFGADIHGKIYGLYSEGGEYALYSNGIVFKNDLDVHLQKTESSAMSVLYTNVSTDVTVQTSGYSKMSTGKCQIEFDENFKKIVSDKVPVVVTITPIGDSKGVFVASVDKNGFSVVENDNGKSSVDIAFIAIGRRAGFENPTLPQDVISLDYTDKISRGLHNDADTESYGEGLYYENGILYVGKHHSTLPDLKKVEDDIPEKAEAPQHPATGASDNNGKAPDKLK